MANVEEFAGLIADASVVWTCTVHDLVLLQGPSEGQVAIDVHAARIGARPAIWYSIFSGGREGRFVEFGRDEATLTDA